ncbi:hypothetical protein KAR91_17490 [Candidatus Pacearchaeota archaeon]|nr:hypothetical protein [Candidatus Pacearchaeota archaeon]
MTLKDFAENINELLEKRPETADFDVVSASDDEGNGFNPVHYDPSTGWFEDGEFNTDTTVDNAVCVN